jgi:hypothetical protein
MNTSRTKSRLKRTLGLAVAPVATCVLMAGLMATPASAEQRCTGATASNVCLNIDPTSQTDQDYMVHIGIDIHMSQAQAQAILDGPGDPFSARMMGSDPLSDDDLFNVHLTGESASAEAGLSANFDMVASRSQLDEDDSFFDDVDEVFGRVKLVDPGTGAVTFYNTPIITRVF